jgi:hypothetical protein
MKGSAGPPIISITHGNLLLFWLHFSKEGSPGLQALGLSKLCLGVTDDLLPKSQTWTCS